MLREMLRHAEGTGFKMGAETERKATESQEKEVEEAVSKLAAALKTRAGELAEERLVTQNMTLELDRLKKELGHVKDERDWYYRGRNKLYNETNELKRELEEAKADLLKHYRNAEKFSDENDKLKGEIEDLNRDHGLHREQLRTLDQEKNKKIQLLNNQLFSNNTKVSELQHELHVALAQVSDNIRVGNLVQVTCGEFMGESRGVVEINAKLDNGATVALSMLRKY